MQHVSPILVCFLLSTLRPSFAPFPHPWLLPPLANPFLVASLSCSLPASLVMVLVSCRQHSTTRNTFQASKAAKSFHTQEHRSSSGATQNSSILWSLQTRFCPCIADLGLKLLREWATLANQIRWALLDGRFGKPSRPPSPVGYCPNWFCRWNQAELKAKMGCFIPRWHGYQRPARVSTMPTTDSAADVPDSRADMKESPDSPWRQLQPQEPWFGEALRKQRSICHKICVEMGFAQAGSEQGPGL